MKKEKEYVGRPIPKEAEREGVKGKYDVYILDGLIKLLVRSDDEKKIVYHKSLVEKTPEKTSSQIKKRPPTEQEIAAEVIRLSAGRFEYSANKLWVVNQSEEGRTVVSYAGINRPGYTFVIPWVETQEPLLEKGRSSETGTYPEPVCSEPVYHKGPGFESI